MLSFCCFLLILASIFCRVTYMMRPNSPDRRHVIGIRSEQQPLDMVYVGGSVTGVSWEPLSAWADFGFTSYDYSTTSAQAENILAYIKDVRRFQEPKLFVIDARPFQYYSTQEEEAPLRRISDSLELTTPIRNHLLKEYFSNREIAADTELAPYYLDIMKYHELTENLGSASCWSLADFKWVEPDKGWYSMDIFAVLDTPQAFRTTQRGNMAPAAQKLLTELLNYGKKAGLNFLFVVTPYSIQSTEQEIFNTMADMVEASGFTFLNTNLCDELELDYASDFSDLVHLNILGADKYTKFLGAYIQERYLLPDHRGDPAYDSWNEQASRFPQKTQQYRSKVLDQQNAAAETLTKTQLLCSVDTLTDWLDIAVSEDYVTVAVAGALPDNLTKYPDYAAISALGFGSDPSWKIRCLSGKKKDTHDIDDVYATYISENELALCYISTDNYLCTAHIRGKDLSVSSDGINLIAIDAWRGTLADQRHIQFDESGQMFFSNSCKTP